MQHMTASKKNALSSLVTAFQCQQIQCNSRLGNQLTIPSCLAIIAMDITLVSNPQMQPHLFR